MYQVCYQVWQVSTHVKSTSLQYVPPVSPSISSIYWHQFKSITQWPSGCYRAVIRQGWSKTIPIDSWKQWLSHKKLPWANRETHGNLRVLHATIYRKPWLLLVFYNKKKGGFLLTFPMNQSHRFHGFTAPAAVKRPSAKRSPSAVKAQRRLGVAASMATERGQRTMIPREFWDVTNIIMGCNN